MIDLTINFRKFSFVLKKKKIQIFEKEKRKMREKNYQLYWYSFLLLNNRF